MTTSRIMLTLRLALASLVLAGCGTGTPDTSGTPDAAGTPGDQGTESTAGEDTATEGPPQVEAAVADLAEREDVEVSAVQVDSVTEVTWPDGALGCPKPGEMYTQALVEGLEIVLTVDGASHTYHSSLEGEPFLCEQPAERRGGGQPNSDG